MVALDIGIRNEAPAQQTPGVLPIGKLALPVKLYLIAVILPVAFHAGPLYMNLLRTVVLIFVVPLLFGLVSGRYGKLFWSDFLFMGHLGWMAVALSIHNPSIVVQNVGSVGMEFIGGYLIARAYIRDRAQFTTLCIWLSFMAMAMLPIALFETLTGRPPVIELIRSIPGITSEAIVNIEERLGLERVQGVFAHPIHFGLFCSVAFSLTYVGLEGVYSQSRRLISSIVIGLCTFLALSSGAILAMVMQAILIGWFTIFRNYDKRWWLLFWLCVAAYIVIDLLSDRSPIRVFMSYATFSAHNAYWRGIIFEWGMMNIIGNAENNIPASPWTGIGMNDWIRPHFMHSGSMDNFWLVLGVRFGLPGFALLAGGYLIALVIIARRKFDGDVQLLNLRRAWMFTFVGLSFTLSTVHVWTTIYSFVFFIFGAGIWMVWAKPQTSQTAISDDGAADPAPLETTSRYTRFSHRMTR